MKFSGKSLLRAEGVTLSGKRTVNGGDSGESLMSAEGVNLSGKRTERTRFHAFVFFLFSLEPPKLFALGAVFFEKNKFKKGFLIMQEFLLKVAANINTYLSNYILVFLLVGTGIFYSIRTRFVQVRCFGEGMKKVFGKISLRGGKQKSGLSSFQALTAAIAAQVGTGNIVGACGAILIGGPGAIFWMWIIAFFGMATIYAEAVLAQETKIVNADGSVLGGPVYYIKRAFKGNFGKFLAGFFAVAITLALGFMGSMVQSNSIAESFGNSLSTSFGWDAKVVMIIVGVIITALSAFIFIGGVQRLAAVTEKIVPIMAVLYLLGSLVVIGANITALPEALGMIFKFAFQPAAILGGGIGYAFKEAISQGAKRGLFSNEAGMGSTPHAHAMANVEKPHDQGVVAMIGVFIDTFIVLTVTALVAITVLYTEGGPLHYLATSGVVSKNFADLAGLLSINKGNMIQLAFSDVFGDVFGSIFVSICLFFFAFSTIISWNFFGKINFNYLFGKKATVVYSVLALVFIFLGSLTSNDLVWEWTDVFNNLMVIPNALALLALSSIVVTSVKNAKSKKSPTLSNTAFEWSDKK